MLLEYVLNTTIPSEEVNPLTGVYLLTKVFDTVRFFGKENVTTVNFEGDIYVHI